jgi:hypothetical protein
MAATHYKRDTLLFDLLEFTGVKGIYLVKTKVDEIDECSEV